MIALSDMLTLARKVKKVYKSSFDGVVVIVFYLIYFAEKSDSDSEGQ